MSALWQQVVLSDRDNEGRHASQAGWSITVYAMALSYVMSYKDKSGGACTTARDHANGQQKQLTAVYVQVRCHCLKVNLDLTQAKGRRRMSNKLNIRERA